MRVPKLVSPQPAYVVEALSRRRSRRVRTRAGSAVAFWTVPGDRYVYRTREDAVHGRRPAR